MAEDKKIQINIELDEQTAQGVYANLAIINHSASEFVLDFVNVCLDYLSPRYVPELF